MMPSPTVAVSTDAGHGEPLAGGADGHILPETQSANTLERTTLERYTGELPPIPHPLRHPLRSLGWGIQTGFGIAVMIALLAVVAAVPILNFLVLGYLLEVQGRVARTGRLRDAFPLIGAAPRVGSLAVGLTIWLFPVSFLAGAAVDAELIAPGSTKSIGLQRATMVVAVLVAIHLCLAVARGGSFGCFFRPIRNVRWLLQRLRAGDYWETAETRVLEYVGSLRLWHLFSLGVRGFVGALAWLFVPTALFAAANRTEGGAFLVTLLGGFLLMFVLAWMPFLQARFAAENRLREMFALRTVRRMFRRAPLAWCASVLVVYVLALPLYLTKVVLLPRDAMWLITPVFIVSIYPAKVLAGWSYHRATCGPERHFSVRWLSRVLLLPTLLLFVFLLFFTQFIGEHGKGVLFEHHAFLLPVPF